MATRDRRQSDAPNIYPLGHPRNPASGAEPAPQRVPTPAPVRRAPAAPPKAPEPSQAPEPEDTAPTEGAPSSDNETTKES